jgi:enamine deaminase RidA (YjgF/YER057c/UK114 family)
MSRSKRHQLIESRIAALRIDLGRSQPSGPYAAVMEEGGLVWVSGVVPSLDGRLVAAGRLGGEVTVETGRQAAVIATLRALNALREHLGDFGRIRRVAKMTVYAQCTPGFLQLGEVATAASETLNTVLAPFGAHARTTVGAAGLPRNAVLELDMIVSLESVA